MKKDKINLSGAEIVSLSASLSICLFEKLSENDIKKLKLLFSSICNNLSIIEAEGRKK